VTRKETARVGSGSRSRMVSPGRIDRSTQQREPLVTIYLSCTVMYETCIVIEIEIREQEKRVLDRRMWLIRSAVVEAQKWLRNTIAIV
jgi:hypothetical protein